MFNDSQFNIVQNLLPSFPQPGKMQKVPCGIKCTYSRASGNISHITRLLKAERKAKQSNRRISEFFQPLNVPGQIKPRKKRLIQTSVCKYLKKNSPPKVLLGKRLKPITILAGNQNFQKLLMDSVLAEKLQHRYKFATMQEAQLRLDQLEQMEPLANFYIEPIEDSQPAQILPDIDIVLMDDTLTEIAGPKSLEYCQKHDDWINLNIKNPDLIKKALELYNQTQKPREFQGLPFWYMIEPGTCRCHRCAVMRNPLAPNPFWWLNIMGCSYTSIMFKMFDIKNSYVPIFGKEYKQQYLLQLKDPVSIGMLTKLELKYNWKRFQIINSRWGKMKKLDYRSKILNLKELQHKGQLVKALEDAYHCARAEILGKSFSCLQPINMQQYMVINNLQFIHEGQIYKLVFLSVKRKVRPDDIRYDRVGRQENVERGHMRGLPIWK